MQVPGGSVKATTCINEMNKERKRMFVCTTYAQPQAQRPEAVFESVSFIKKQLEFLHLQFISLMTSSVLA